MAKASVEAAVRAVQLYIGCDGRVNVRDAQRLYAVMMRKIATVARQHGMSELEAHTQIFVAARRRGGICPIPGRDI